MLRLLLGKDLRVLVRARLELCGLVLYPLLLAILVALVARDAGGRPRIAYVDEAHLPSTLAVGGTSVDYGALLAGVRGRVELVPMSAADARAALRDGSVLAVVTVPERFLTDLQTTVRAPEVTVAVREGAGGERALAEIQALAYRLNAGIQRELLDQALGFLKVVATGGTADIAGRQIDVYGLAGSAAAIDRLLPRVKDPADRAALARVRDFAAAARLALAFAEPSLKVVAQPVHVAATRTGSDDLLGTRGVGVILAVGVVLAGVLLGAVALATERDENVLVRLARLVPGGGLGTLVAAKVVFVAIVGLCLGLLVTALYLVVAALTSAPAPALARLPLLVPVLLLAAAAAGAVGALVATIVRDVAASALVATLVALPFVLAGLVGSSGGLRGAVTAIFPFSPAVAGAAGVLYDAAPAAALGAAVVNLGLITLVAGVGARALARRLLS
jgi:hypothetical protein